MALNLMPYKTTSAKKPMARKTKSNMKVGKARKINTRKKENPKEAMARQLSDNKTGS